MSDLLTKVLVDYSLITAFAVIGLVVAFAHFFSARVTRGRLHGSAIAVVIGLLLAYLGGVLTGGKNGIADIPIFAGIALMGGTMLRDFAIAATAMGVRIDELQKAGLCGVVALLMGLTISFLVGACVAFAFGYRDAVSIATIGGGGATFIIGPVTGSAIGASSEVIALSVATGVMKAILVMVLTPFAAKFMKLDNPRTALIFGGLMITTSGVSAGLAATDQKLVPYGAMGATFCTGLGCLLGPAVFYPLIRFLV